jgi:hypothetical protein
MDYDQGTKLNRVNREQLTEEIDVMFGLERDKSSWSNCYFTRVKSDLYHNNGDCMACDWRKYSDTLTRKQISEFDFIEAWEWPEIWLRKRDKT